MHPIGQSLQQGWLYSIKRANVLVGRKSINKDVVQRLTTPESIVEKRGPLV